MMTVDSLIDIYKKTRRKVAATVRLRMEKRGVKISKRQTDAFMKEVFDAIAGEMIDGKYVSIPGFGAFSAVYREARIFKSPYTDRQFCERRMVPKFRPSGKLRKLIRQSGESMK